MINCTPAGERPQVRANPFQSFWMGGFECADMLNIHRQRVDLSVVTGHLQQTEEDYLRLLPFSIKTVREGIRWSQVEKTPYIYDWKHIRSMMQTGLKTGIQQVWDLCHFGFPDGLSPLDPDFEQRFIALCLAFVRCYRDTDPASTMIVTPINEVSFLSWLGGDRAGTVPYRTDAGWEMKYALMKAYISGIKAMKHVDKNLLVLTTEPLVNIVPDLPATPEQMEEALTIHELQFQVAAILEGTHCPELGGNPTLADMHGLNFYHNNQWIAGSFKHLPWANESNDIRWKPLHQLMEDHYLRFKKPLVLSETSHPKEHRPDWLRFINRECVLLKQKAVPLWGACWYPIIDRPDWDNLSIWHHAGLWDIEVEHSGLHRIPYEPLAEVFMSDL